MIKPLHAGMGPAILAHLRKFTDFPRDGFVAGQAVSSAVSELFGDGKAVVYNDVDVFRERTQEESNELAVRHANQYEVTPRKSIQTCTFTTLEIKQGYEMMIENAMGRYKVVGTHRKDMLNEVFCDFTTKDPVKFLQTFDINACQALVDLKTEKLVWTPQFESFTISRQLDITTLHTPFHTLIRYFRKKEELAGTYGNDERIIELLAAAYYLEIGKETVALTGIPQEYTDTRWRFGRIYLHKLDSVAGLVLPHFEVKTELVNDYPVTTLVPRFQVESDILSANIGNMVHGLPSVSRALREKHAKGVKARLDYLIKPSTSTVTDKPASLSAIGWKMMGDSFLTSNVSPLQMERMDKVAREHSISEHLIAPTLGEQMAKLQLIQAAVSKRGLWVYGVLENIKAQDWTSDSLTTELDKQEQLLKESLAPVVFEPMEIDGFKTRELVTGIDLQTEGVALHHCVGGYASSVASGQSRIISIRKGNRPSGWLTVQLVKSDNAWISIQCLGLLNRSASPEEKKVAEKYADLSNLADFVGVGVTKTLIKGHPQFAYFIGNQLTKLYQRKRNIPKLLTARSRDLARQLGSSCIFDRRGNVFSVYLDHNKFWKLYLKNKVITKLGGRPIAFKTKQKLVLTEINGARSRGENPSAYMNELSEDIPF